MRHTSPLIGTIKVPGDKSISHRAVILAGMSDRESRVRGFLPASDTLRTVEMMRALGVEVLQQSPTQLRIVGRGLRGFIEPADVIDAGNSGTTIRIGAGLLAGQPFLSVITGDRYLRNRPMDRIVEPLSLMGAKILGRCRGTRPPLCFSGGDLAGVRFQMSVPSAQVKSALLLAGLRARDSVTVIESIRTRDHTERMLQAMGAMIEVLGNEVTVRPATRLDPLDICVPGDFSSAAFFLVLGASVPGSDLLIDGVGMNPFRVGLLHVLKRMGADIRVESLRNDAGEPVANVGIHGSNLSAILVTPEEIPGLIDEVPVLCVAAALAKGRTEIRGAAELRVKESDRIAAMMTAFTELGIPCGEYPDGLWVDGPAMPRPGKLCDTRGDHRIAMALMILSAATGVAIDLTDTTCIDTSFPGFRELLDGLIRGRC